MGRTFCVQKLFFTFRTIFICSAKRRASDKDLPVLHNVKLTVKVSSTFVAFLENMDFKRNADFEESAEAFWNVEEHWDEVLSKIDVALNKGVKGCVVIKKVGDIAPLDTALINVKNQDTDCRLENVLDEHLG